MLAVAPLLVSALLGVPAQLSAATADAHLPPAQPLSAALSARIADAPIAPAPAKVVPRATERRFHIGLEGRSDLWRHPLRLATGVSFGALDLTLITDPGVIFDGKHEADLLVGWWFIPHAWQLAIGFRNSSMPVLHGRRYDEALVLGLDAALPKLDGKHLRATVGVTLALDLYRHGGGIPARSLPSRVPDLADFISFGFNARFEWAGAL